jgi:hypothetical protein
MTTGGADIVPLRLAEFPADWNVGVLAVTGDGITPALQALGQPHVTDVTRASIVVSACKRLAPQPSAAQHGETSSTTRARHHSVTTSERAALPVHACIELVRARFQMQAQCDGQFELHSCAQYDA